MIGTEGVDVDVKEPHVAITVGRVGLGPGQLSSDPVGSALHFEDPDHLAVTLKLCRDLISLTSFIKEHQDLVR